MELNTKVLYSRETIEARVKELAAEILASYPKDDVPIVCVCVLRGAVIFFSDLMKNFEDDRVVLDFVTLSSYDNAMYTSGKVKLIHDLRANVEGKHVLVVEDIIDSGYTLDYLYKYFQSKNVVDVKVATLLDKPLSRKVDVKPDFSAFVLDRSPFIIGYGLDLDQKYRNIDCIKEVIQ